MVNKRYSVDWYKSIISPSDVTSHLNAHELPMLQVHNCPVSYRLKVYVLFNRHEHGTKRFRDHMRYSSHYVCYEMNSLAA